MIVIQPSPYRIHDPGTVSKDGLIESSRKHIDDVRQALSHFARLLDQAGATHDADKLTDIDTFHRDCLDGFVDRVWFDSHLRNSRHHLADPAGVPADVDLIDVLEYIADCVMSGLARSGHVRPVEIHPDLLRRAFVNTAEKLAAEVVVTEPAPGDRCACGRPLLAREVEAGLTGCASCVWDMEHGVKLTP